MSCEDCPPGPLTTLCQTLSGLITPGQPLTITPSTIASVSIGQLFTNFLLDAGLVLDGAQAGFPPGLCSQLQLTGTGMSAPFENLAISATFTFSTAANEYEMTLVATQPAGATDSWTLSQAFTTLAGTEFDNVPIGSPQLTLDSTAAAGQQFQFTGEVQFATLPVGPLFGGASSVNVTGYVTAVSAAGPSFTIGSANTLVVSLGGLFELAPQFTLQSAIPQDATQPSAIAGVNLVISAGDTSLTVTALLPFASTYDFLSNADDTLDFGFALLSSLTGLDFTALMPSQITLPGNFSLQTWTLSLQMSTLSLTSITLTAGTSSSWPILSSITLDSLTFTFSDNPGLVPAISVTVGATLTLGSGGTPAVLALSGTGPSFAFWGMLQSGAIDLDALVSTFSTTVGSLVPAGLAVTTLFFSVAPSSSVYQFNVTISANWPIPGLSAFSVENVSFAFSDTAGVISASVTGTVALDASTTLTVSASFDSSGWTFTGTLTDLTLDAFTGVIQQYFPTLASILGELQIEINSLTLTLAPDGYAFDCDVAWSIPLAAGDSLAVDATIAMQMPAEGDGPTGTIAGSASYNGSLPLTVGATLTGGTLSGIALGWSTAGGSFTATIDPAASTATFAFANLNIGQIVSELAGLISPGFSLTAPWNLLNSASLPDFSVAVDFTTKQATFSVDLDADLVFIDIETVGMTVDWVAEAVSFSIPSGTFLGVPIGQALDWDIVPPASGPATPAPAVPGAGSSLFDLQFLALAQHFAPVTPLDETSVTAALQGLQTAFGGSTPGSGVAYDSATDWIIAVNAQLLGGTVSIGAVFIDPVFYGLAISVGSGSDSPLSQFSGLDFEILYKKVSPGLGVYQTNVTLPDFIRNIQLGAVSVTLPSIGVSIYTNGDFLIDIGFPWNGDFSRSCTMQMLPFTGSGGFYFGILPASAVPVVPATTLGTFNPVVVFGIGVQAGIGKTVTYGILSGGLTLTVQGIIEGVFAPFNPAGGSAGSGDLFYSVSGQVAIVGHLYGEINFAIISARFDVLISVGAAINMTAYQPVLLNVTATVSVAVTATLDLGIFSISIGLSFSTTVSQQFTIGSGSQAPWETPAIANARMLRLVRTTMNVALSWAPVTSSPAQGVPLLLVSNPTAASAVENGTLGPANAQIVMMTYTGYTPQGSPAPATPSSFATLAEGILLWAVSAGVNGGNTVSAQTVLDTTVTLAQINGTYDALAATPFQWSDVEALFAGYFDFTIAQPDSGSGATAAVSVFPILPVLSMTLPDQTLIDFATFNTATAAQLAAIQADFARMQPGVPFAGGGSASPGTGSSSVATFLFADYVMLLCKGVLQAASDVLAASGNESGLTVSSIVATINGQLGLDAIAPQAARVFLQGLRPPWPTPASPPQSLYAISGQQFDASALVATDSITMSLAAGVSWARFVTGDETSATATIAIGSLATTLSALDGASITPDLTSQAAEPVNSVAMQFTLTQPAVWQGPAPANWTTYAFPSSLVQILADNTKLAPVMELGELNQNGSPVTPPSSFSWMTSFALDIALVPSAANPANPLPNTYNVFGTDAVGGAYLQALIEAAAGSSTILIDQIYIAYPPSPGGSGLTSEPVTSATQFFVVQTNLSTESNPGDSFFRLFPAVTGVDPVGQTSLELLQLLWQCSVVRSGGYFLFYAGAGGDGLPGSLFDADGRAELTIVVTYGYAPSDPLQTFLSGIVVTESIDPGNNLYLQAVSSNVIAGARDTTLGELARRSRKTVYQVVRANADVPIAAGEDVLVPRGRGLDAESVRLARASSFAAIARREHVSLARLARANRDRSLQFETFLTLDPILLTNAQTMSAGCAGFLAAAAPDGGDGNDAQSILDQQYQLLGYQIAATAAFQQSPFGLPLSPAPPASGGSGTVYSATMPVASFATDGGANSGQPGQPPPLNDPYRGIGQEVQFTLNWQDVFGNVVTTNPSIAAPAGSNPYSVGAEILFFDNLIALSQWPAIGMSYTIAPETGTGTPQLSIALTFDASRYSRASAGLLQGDQAAFAAIYYQIARNATITAGSTLDPALSWDITTDLVGFVVAVYAYITSVVNGAPGTVPAPPALAMTIGDTRGEAFFQLEVTVTIARPSELIDPTVDDPLLGAIGSVSTTILPSFQAPAGQSSTTTLLQFALELQACFPTLMLAAGIPDSTAATEQVYVVRFGESGYQFTFGDPVYFALPPLALAPLSLTGVSILQYSSGTPIGSAPAVNMAFSNVNLDQLASSFLSSIDLFLSPDLVIPAWTAVAASGSADNPIGDILTTKAALASAIAALLQPPLESQMNATATLLVAVAKLEQELLIQLSAAYQINTIVTVPVAPGVAPGAPEVSLYGKPAAAAGSSGVYAFSAASLPLGVPDPPSLAFTFSTSDPQDASLVELTVSYAINNCQFGFEPMPPPLDGFTASSWLTFAMPFSSASSAVQNAVSFGAALPLEIPVPLRAFPTTPSIASQTAAGTPLPASPAPASTRLWTYSFDYDYVAASQDDIHATVALQPSGTTIASLPSPGFAQALLQFSASWPLLLPDLASSDSGTAVNAMQWLSVLADAIAQSWPALAVPASLPPSDFAVVSEKGPEGQLRVTVVIESEGYPFERPWIEIDGYTTTQPSLLPEPSYEFADPTGALLSYETALTIPSRTVLLTPPGAPAAASFDVLVQPMAWAAVSVVRNESYEEQPGNPSFIYATPFAQQVTPAVPLLEPGLSLDMAASTIDPAPQPLATYLNNFLTALFTTLAGDEIAPQTITLSCGYQYQIAPGLTVTVPILITTPATVSPGDALVAAVASQADTWLSGAPAVAGAQLVFAVSLFSATASSGGSSSLPLLQLDSVVLAVSDIATS